MSRLPHIPTTSSFAPQASSTATEKFVLAVDGGGTKTKVLCANLEGKVVGEGESGPTNLTVTSTGAAAFNLREAIRQATAPLGENPHFAVLSMGLAGMDTPKEQDEARAMFSQVLQWYQLDTFTLVNDIHIALESGTDAVEAVALIAGTGSNCFGRNAQGETAKTGGMDYLLTDQGSGYDLGRRTLREAIKSFDGRAPKSLLEKLVAEHFHIESLASLKDKVYNPHLTKAQVAQLATLCEQAYQQGDSMAQQLLTDAATQLRIMIYAVVKRLNMEDRAVECVLAGSIAQLEVIESEIQRQILPLVPHLHFIIPQQPPVYGALKIALRQVRDAAQYQNPA